MYVFSGDKMRKYLLDKGVRGAGRDDAGTVKPLSREIADSVASGMKQWAMDMGATHYTHWFQPLTGGTAEKHDAFVEYDGRGGVIEEFSGKLLIQQEPDASIVSERRYPQHVRSARVFSAWDATSPAFVVDTTLCIPTIFISYTGESLDYKVPLLKALAGREQSRGGGLPPASIRK